MSMFGTDIENGLRPYVTHLYQAAQALTRTRALIDHRWQKPLSRMEEIVLNDLLYQSSGLEQLAVGLEEIVKALHEYNESLQRLPEEGESSGTT